MRVHTVDMDGVVSAPRFLTETARVVDSPFGKHSCTIDAFPGDEGGDEVPEGVGKGGGEGNHTDNSEEGDGKFEWCWGVDLVLNLAICVEIGVVSEGKEGDLLAKDLNGGRF